MRHSLIVPLALIASACSQQPSRQNETAAQPDLPSLIAADDPTVCASSQAIRTALTAADKQYGEALTNGMPEIRVDTVSATGINKDIHEITCSATGHAKSAYTGDEQSFSMLYKLRPSLDWGGGFIAEIESSPQVKDIIAGHVLRWTHQNASKSAEETQPVGATENVAAAYTGPDGTKKEDICNSKVLQEIASIEDPTSKMEPGEDYNDVTQFWRNKASGETRFCQHGGYCYPSHVTVNGQKVEAIKLTNCAIREQVSEDKDDILYGVW